MAIDDTVPAPLPAGSIAPPPPPRQLSPGLQPKATLSSRDAATMQSVTDELGRREVDEERLDEEVGVVEEEDAEAERDALSNKRYGDADDPYAGLGDAFGS